MSLVLPRKKLRFTVHFVPIVPVHIVPYVTLSVPSIVPYRSYRAYRSNRSQNRSLEVRVPTIAPHRSYNLTPWVFSRHHSRHVRLYVDDHIFSCLASFPVGGGCPIQVQHIIFILHAFHRQTNAAFCCLFKLILCRSSDAAPLVLRNTFRFHLTLYKSIIYNYFNSYMQRKNRPESEEANETKNLPLLLLNVGI